MGFGLGAAIEQAWVQANERSYLPGMAALA